MEMEQASALRIEWGNKHCEHTNLEKEFYLGSPTGDYACTKCGAVGWGKDWAEKEKPEEQ